HDALPIFTLMQTNISIFKDRIRMYLFCDYHKAISKKRYNWVYQLIKHPMKPFLVIIILIFTFGSLHAQVEIYGKVFDKTKNNNLEGATIQLLNTKDSTRYLTKTDAKGLYKFSKISAGSYTLSTSLIGFKKSVQTLALSTKPLELNFELEPGEILLEEITIAPVPDVAVRGDTMEFNTRNFMTREYADADEMVAQVPGVTIDEEGNVSAHGEPVG